MLERKMGLPHLGLPTQHKEPLHSDINVILQFVFSSHLFFLS